MSSRPSRGAARLASILDALPDALLLVDVNGTVVNANAIALETFESPGTALVGRGLLDLLPAFDSKRIPGSMRSPREAAAETRTRPTRMVARRTDGRELPVEVTSANLDGGRTPYADYGDGVPHYTGDELLMLVVRDLSGTVDTEAELARQQRQTEMILRAAAEGVVGVDTAGKVVLVNPSAAQILGHRATDLGGHELHPLVHHSRADGTPLAYEETPLADTLRSGRKHRVRGQVLWRKDGRAVPVDLTTAPVRDGDQLVGAVMTFTDRTGYDALAARNQQLGALLDTSLRGPLAELRAELTGLATDPAGHLWPEANQILHHLSAGYARITTLIDNVLAFQRLDRGEEKLRREQVSLDDVVGAAVEGAIELIGPGRAQYAVHAPPIAARVDPARMSQALAHLIADVAGVDSAGNTIAFSGDSTIVVAAAQRGDVVRIDVRGPHAGGDPVHLPLARGIVERHGGVLQTHEVPGRGSAYVLEVPVGTVGPAAAAAAAQDTAERSPAADATADVPSTQHGQTARGGQDRHSGHGAGGSQASPGAPARNGAESAREDARPAAPAGTGTGTSTGARPSPAGGAAPRAPRPRQAADDSGTAVAPWAIPAAADQSEAPTGRRRALRRPDGDGDAAESTPGEAEGARPSGRRARRVRPEDEPDGRPELPAPPIPHALPAAGGDTPAGAARAAEANRQEGPGGPGGIGAPGAGHRAHRAIEPPAGPGAPAGPGTPGSLGTPAGPGTVPLPVPPQQGPADAVGRRAVEHPKHAPHPQTPPPQTAHPQTARAPQSGWPAPHAPSPAAPGSAPSSSPAQGDAGTPGIPAGPEGNSRALPAQPSWPAAPQNGPQNGPAHTPGNPAGNSPANAPAHNPPAAGNRPPGQDESPSGHSRAISVRTLGQGVPYAADQQPQTQTQAVQAQHPQGLPAQVAAGGSGRRRRLNPPQPQVQPQTQVPGQGRSQGRSQGQGPAEGTGPGDESQARQHPQADPDSGQLPISRPDQQGPPVQQGQHSRSGQQAPQPKHDDHETALLRPVPAEPEQAAHTPGRSYAIGAPAAGAAEGPEPLDGPNGAVDVTEVTEATEVSDDRPDETLDEPRRLLVWPEPDVSTRQALTDRGYRPVIVRSREEVDAQIAEPPAALFVDPLTGPITRTALQSLRQAAAAADVPVLVTAGLGQATREAAYGADPAVLLKALAPRDSEQHPPRVLLVEGHEPIAQAFAATLERRGMQVTHADSETDAMSKAAQLHPNLVVMDLMLIRRRRQGIVDWLRGNARLNSTPLVVYTSADIDPGELPRLASGETVLFLAERSTSTDVQSRIVDLLGKIGS